VAWNEEKEKKEKNLTERLLGTPRYGSLAFNNLVVEVWRSQDCEEKIFEDLNFSFLSFNLSCFLFFERDLWNESLTCPAVDMLKEERLKEEEVWEKE